MGSRGCMGKLYPVSSQGPNNDLDEEEERVRI